MKTLFVGLDGVPAELLLRPDRLPVLGGLMEMGRHGRIVPVTPAAPVPSWTCVAAGRDPGGIGVYGSGEGADVAPHGDLVWDVVARSGARADVLAVPGFAATGGGDDVFGRLRERIAGAPWDLLFAVDTSFARRARELSRSAPGDAPADEVLLSHLERIDAELGATLAALEGDTAVIVASPAPAVGLRGELAVNRWLVEQGLLALRSKPAPGTPVRAADVDWDRTVCWCEGTDAVRIRLNLRGRDPHGVVEPKDALRVRDDVAGRLVMWSGADRLPLGHRVFRTETAYRALRGQAPDLVVQLGGIAWSAADDVGAGPIVRPAPNPIGAEWEAYGAYVLAGPGVTASETPVEGSALDLAPTLLTLAGIPLPATLHGRSFLEAGGADDAAPVDEEEEIRERLRGLGYL